MPTAMPTISAAVRGMMETLSTAVVPGGQMGVSATAA
jgi:hypothetical protein